jgi:sarcosine oxidase subunit beta
MAIRVIGGGIIGLSVAYHLSLKTEDITVFEIDPGYTRASFARSCGGLRSQFSTAANIAMSLYSIDFLKKNTDVSFKSNGYLLLFDAGRAKDHDQSLVLQQEMGASTQSIDPDEL